MANIQDLVKSIQEEASDWEIAGQDSGMEGVYKRDANDIREVASLLESGKPTKARRAAELLDTLVRELLPATVWNYFDSLDD